MNNLEQFITENACNDLPTEIIQSAQLSKYASNGMITEIEDFHVIEVTKVSPSDSGNPNVITGAAVLKITGSLYEKIPGNSPLSLEFTSDVIADYKITLDDNGKLWKLTFSNVILSGTVVEDIE